MAKVFRFGVVSAGNASRSAKPISLHRHSNEVRRELTRRMPHWSRRSAGYARQQASVLIGWNSASLHLGWN